jgi:hypothetical protein
MNQASEPGGLSVRAGGLITALLLIIVGCIVMIGSLEQGIGWDEAGPMAGYVPFYVGLFLTLSSLGTGWRIIAKWSEGSVDMTTRTQLKRVLSVFIPICVYVALMPFIGMYVSSGLIIAWFMRNKNEAGTRFGWIKTLGISIAAPVAAYVIFALWFEIPLYPGPFPGWFGL